MDTSSLCNPVGRVLVLETWMRGYTLCLHLLGESILGNDGHRGDEDSMNYPQPSSQSSSSTRSHWYAPEKASDRSTGCMVSVIVCLCGMRLLAVWHGTWVGSGVSVGSTCVGSYVHSFLSINSLSFISAPTLPWPHA